MFRSVGRNLWALCKPDLRRKTQRPSRPRRLIFEGLEGRALLSASASNLISDSSFETPALGASAFQYTPASAAWQFAGGAGIASNNSAFTAKNPNAPDGTQVAFLQGGGSMSQSVYLTSGSYNLSLMAAQRGSSCQAHYQEFQVLVDGTQVGLVSPTSTSYGSYQTQDFTVTTGTHTIKFVGLNPAGGDNTAFVDEVTVSPKGDSISDGSFEAPTLVANTFLVSPTGSAWQFAGGAGVTANSSPFTSSNPNAPDGNQVAFLQGGGSMGQTLYLDAGSYVFTFAAAQRGGSAQQHAQEIEVLVDGAQVGLVTPSGTGYTQYQTLDFQVAAGRHTVRFVGVDPSGGDCTAFVDEVSLTSVPETITDGSFETPALAGSTYQYTPSGSGWQFTSGAGIAANGSSFTSGSAAPDGSQAAFLQGGGSMSQTLYLDAGSYNLTFEAAQRASQTSAQEFEVLVDWKQVGVVTPSGSSYGYYQTQNFTVTAGKHTIEFLGMNPAGGDNTALIDKVAIAVQADWIGDGSFVAPTVAADSYQYTPTGSAWVFTSGAGVAANGSGFTASNPAAPYGTQVAFLQDSGSMSQSLYLDAGTYNLSFMAAQRASPLSAQEIEVLVDGNQVGTFTPSAASYTSEQTQNFTVTAGTHIVKFVGLNPAGGDNTALIDGVSLTAQSNLIGDSSFETVTLPANTYDYTPTGSAWQFTGLSGIAANGSAFTSVNPSAPVGNQVGFVQVGGSMSQSVYLAAGTYNLSFDAAQRGGVSQQSYEEIEVLIDGNVVSTITPTSTNYAAYETSTFTLTAGMHSIEFLGLDPSGGDNTAFIDNVQI